MKKINLLTYPYISCLGAVMVERPAEIEGRFSQVAPLIYHFGHSDVDANLTLSIL